MQEAKLFFELHRTDLISFESIYFISFVIISVFAYHTLKRSKLILLIISLIFYSSFSLKMTIFVFLLALTNYVGGVVLFLKKSVILLVFLIALDTFMLLYYKYFNFFADSINSLHVAPHIQTLSYLVIPLGISFFTFELVHYVTDIYKGKRPILNPLTFLNFVFFFPTLFAGPIKRFENFAPQFYKKSRIEYFENSLLIVKGLTKKILIANNAGNFATFGFQTNINPLVVLIGIFAFSFQIYFDFSGYTDVARGIAGLLGFKIPENFFSPYLSKNIQEFWRKWHVTLMGWIRDYVYIPLGGSRVGKLRHYLNILIVFSLSGLWHGASWHFVVWGIYHAFGMIVYTFFNEKKLFKVRINSKIAILITFIFVSVGWIFFRAQNLQDVGRILLLLSEFGKYSVPYELSNRFLMLGFLLIGYFFSGRIASSLNTRYPQLFIPSRIFIYSVSLLLVTISLKGQPFIYFQF